LVISQGIFDARLNGFKKEWQGFVIVFYGEQPLCFCQLFGVLSKSSPHEQQQKKTEKIVLGHFTNQFGARKMVFDSANIVY